MQLQFCMTKGLPTIPEKFGAQPSIWRPHMARLLAAVFAMVWLGCGCGTHWRTRMSPQTAKEAEAKRVQQRYPFTKEQEDKILALNPEQIMDKDIRTALAGAPAPRMLLIHGGVRTVIRFMVSFGDFLIGMGYPAQSITNPVDGMYSFSCLGSARELTGLCAWHYEKDGLRPMIVGHSQGGFQVVKVLYWLAGENGTGVPVWNPLTWKSEKRCEFTDPLTGEQRPVVCLKLPYATVVGAGGLTRVLPNQWHMIGRLRAIPDSVDEFTGFYMPMDWKGGDLVGAANRYHALGNAKVRSVKLPWYYSHYDTPKTRHLLKSEFMKEWINDYRPRGDLFSEPKVDIKFEEYHENILWAADVWFSIKKHWVLELQNLIRAHRANSTAHAH